MTVVGGGASRSVTVVVVVVVVVVVALVSSHVPASKDVLHDGILQLLPLASERLHRCRRQRTGWLGSRWCLGVDHDHVQSHVQFFLEDPPTCHGETGIPSHLVTCSNGSQSQNASTLLLSLSVPGFGCEDHGRFAGVWMFFVGIP